jgi:alginate O-acetyltransferase complex protein AlgI
VVTNPLFWILLVLGPPVYWLVPARFRMWLLAAISAGYVASISGWGIAALVTLMLATWAVPAGEGRSRTWLRLVLLALLGYLAWFKYVPELARALAPESSLAAIALPLGISFFTFKLIHVAVEIARGNLRDRSPATFAAYVFLFPIFTAGPIEQYDHFLKNREARPTAAGMAEGIWRIILGLIKKFIVAELLVFDLLMGGRGFASFHAGLPEFSTPGAWTYLFLAFVYGYFDFAGYSDIAIGSSRLFGIRVMENFNNPMLARNLAEFWKRWHMSLAAWTQRYVYMPTLGLTRNPWLGVYLTFIAMGLWHAGNLSFLCWGVYHATGVSVVLLVQRHRRLRQGRPFPVIDRIPGWGTALTWVFLAGSAGFAASSGLGGSVLQRTFAKLIGIDLGP